MGEVVKDPVIHGDAVFEVPEILRIAVQLAQAAHGDGHHVDAVPLGGGDQAVAGGVGVAGFDAGRPFIQIAAGLGIVGIGADEGVGVVHNRAVVDGRIIRLVALGIGNLHEQGVLHGGGSHQIKVVGGAVVVLRRQAVGIHEMGVDTAQLRRLLVHLIHKGTDAAGNIGGQHVAGLVGGMDHGAVQQVLHRDLGAGGDAGIAAVLR